MIYSKTKRSILIGLVVLAAFYGVAITLMEEGSTLEIVFDIVTCTVGAMMIYTWCLYDSLARNRRIGILFGVLIFGLAIIGVPIYLLKTRGLRGMVSIVLAAVFFCCSVIVAALSGLVTVFFLGEI